MMDRLELSEVKQVERLWVKATQIELRQQANYDQSAQRLGIAKKKGLLRCQGRLKHAELDQEGREPLILPKEHPLTNIIVKSCHEKLLHSGLRATLAEVRVGFGYPKVGKEDSSEMFKV